jgi:tRNA uridine 5-carboxymethylaminomethyl modification enzyme
LRELGSPPIKNIISLAQLLKRSEILFSHLKQFDPGISDIPEDIMREVETRLKYEGYIERQERQVDKLKRMEESKLPETINYEKIHGLSTEVKEKLNKVRPISLGQASRIAGVTPAALMAIQVHLKRFGSSLANTPDRAFS